MRKSFITTIAAIAMTTTAAADPLYNAEMAFVEGSMGTLWVLKNCPAYETVTNSLITLGDQVGVDSYAMTGAVTEAIKMFSHQDYDRSLLRPEVTRMMIELSNRFDTAVAQNRIKFCNEIGAFLVERGLIKRK
jgi:hypothetical protein